MFFDCRIFMAYAAYRENIGTVRPQPQTVFSVLDVIVATAVALRVRRGIAQCPGAGVLRCEPLKQASASCPSAAPRARLIIRLPTGSYAQVLHCLMECAPDGEIGHLVAWRDHLASRGLGSGG
ncbi:MAG TPA: hypothetical protein VGI11_09730 [Variovorax sp.]